MAGERRSLTTLGIGIRVHLRACKCLVEVDPLAFIIRKYNLLDFSANPHPSIIPSSTLAVLGVLKIMAQLSSPGFAVDISEVKDDRLRRLLQGLLDVNPKKRVRFFDSPITRLSLL